MRKPDYYRSSQADDVSEVIQLLSRHFASLMMEEGYMPYRNTGKPGKQLALTRMRHVDDDNPDYLNIKRDDGNHSGFVNSARSHQANSCSGRDSLYVYKYDIVAS